MKPISLTKSERSIVRLVGAVQFINILDFMMVMPMGPDFAQALSIPTHHIGIVGGSYTAAAFISGLVGSLYLDRFDRRKALAVAMLGLVISTALGGFAIDLNTLIAARFLAGFFGGPAAALSLALVADGVAPERRGRAMGAVSASFSLASVVGVPIGLELARLGGWRMPFFAIAGLGFIIAAAVIKIMQPQRGHLSATNDVSFSERLATLKEIASRSATLLAMFATMAGIFGNFVLIPNLSAYFQFNLGFPRAHLAWLYTAGGFVSFFSMRYAGRLVDRFGSTKVITVISACVIVSLYVLFIDYQPGLPLVVLFTLFMMFNTARFVVINTTNSKVPKPHERAGFMSLVTAAQHFGSSIAAFISSFILVERSGGALEHMPRLAWLAISIICLVPLAIYRLEARLKAKPIDLAVEKTADLTAFE